MTHSNNYSYHRRRRKRASLFPAFRNILVLAAICFAIKYLACSNLGKAFDSAFAKFTGSESVVSDILSFETGLHDKSSYLSYLENFFNFHPPTNPDLPSSKGTVPAPLEYIGDGGNAKSSPNFSSPTASQNYPDANFSGIRQLLQAGAGGEIDNHSGLDIDFSKYAAEDTYLSTDFKNASVLIIHTHGSEAYKPDEEDIYVASDPSRTEDRNYNMIRVGNELCSILNSRGINAVHDVSLYDYPSYNGSYSRSYVSMLSYLENDPSIKIIIDLHRDAVTDGDNPYKTSVTINNELSSQVMIIAGTNATGLSHPLWEENAKLALLLQGCMNIKYPSLARPLYISEYRFNQSATTGSLLVEIGYNGNTLKEALAAARFFGDCLGDVYELLQ